MRIAPQAEPGTRSILVALALPNPEERLRGGQYAVARVQLDDPEPRLTVPKTALVGSDGQQQLWVIEKGELKRRLVTTGRVDADAGRVEILGGIGAESMRRAWVLAARIGLWESRSAGLLECCGRAPIEHSQHRRSS